VKLFWLFENQKEEAMHNYITIGKLVVVAAALVILAAGRAEAGASASAPSKNKNQQFAQQQSGHKTAKNDFGITEYSSSSARNRQH
jgi:hypothetical protein